MVLSPRRHVFLFRSRAASCCDDTSDYLRHRPTVTCVTVVMITVWTRAACAAPLSDGTLHAPTGLCDVTARRPRMLLNIHVTMRVTLSFHISGLMEQFNQKMKVRVSFLSSPPPPRQLESNYWTFIGLNISFIKNSRSQTDLRVRRLGGRFLCSCFRRRGEQLSAARRQEEELEAYCLASH